VNACEVKSPPDRMLAIPRRRLFLAAYTLGLNLVVSLLPCVADCYVVYIVCKVERLVLTN